MVLDPLQKVILDRILRIKLNCDLIVDCFSRGEFHNLETRKELRDNLIRVSVSIDHFQSEIQEIKL